MALIIKGDMPKACSACKSVQRYRYSDECEYLRKPIARNGRLKDCPILGEIPDEHGDLIERSPLVQKIKDEWQKIHEETGYDVKGIFWNKLVEIIESSEVVLEAST